jgi:hypothetical protein
MKSLYFSILTNQNCKIVHFVSSSGKPVAVVNTGSIGLRQLDNCIIELHKLIDSSEIYFGKFDRDKIETEITELIFNIPHLSTENRQTKIPGIENNQKIDFKGKKITLNHDEYGFSLIFLIHIFNSISSDNYSGYLVQSNRKVLTDSERNFILSHIIKQNK